MPLRGMVAKPRWRSMGWGFEEVWAAHSRIISTSRALTSSRERVSMRELMSTFWALRKFVTFVRQSRARS